TCGQEPYQEGRRKADDVQVVALDPLDEGGSTALDGIRPCPALPLADADVGRQVARVELAEGHPRDLVLDLLPRGREQAQAGDHLVRLPRERLEHSLRLRGGSRLA